MLWIMALWSLRIKISDTNSGNVVLFVSSTSRATREQEGKPHIPASTRRQSKGNEGGSTQHASVGWARFRFRPRMHMRIYTYIHIYCSYTAQLRRMQDARTERRVDSASRRLSMFTDGSYTKSTSAHTHTHRELIRECGRQP